VDKFDLSSVRLIFSGAAPLGADIEMVSIDSYRYVLTRITYTVRSFQEVVNRLSNKPKIKQGYGLTETSPTTHSNPTARIKQVAIGSIYHTLGSYTD